MLHKGKKQCRFRGVDYHGTTGRKGKKRSSYFHVIRRWDRHGTGILPFENHGTGEDQTLHLANNDETEGNEGPTPSREGPVVQLWITLDNSVLSSHFVMATVGPVQHSLPAPPVCLPTSDVPISRSAPRNSVTVHSLTARLVVQEIPIEHVTVWEYVPWGAEGGGEGA